MANELTITNLECALTKLRLEPGDVLIVKCRAPMRHDDEFHIRRAIEESFNVPAMVLPHDIDLQAVLNISPELIERARHLGEERLEKQTNELLKAVAVA